MRICRGRPLPKMCEGAASVAPDVSGSIKAVPAPVPKRTPSHARHRWVFPIHTRRRSCCTLVVRPMRLHRAIARRRTGGPCGALWSGRLRRANARLQCRCDGRDGPGCSELAGETRIGRAGSPRLGPVCFRGGNGRVQHPSGGPAGSGAGGSAAEFLCRRAWIPTGSLRTRCPRRAYARLRSRLSGCSDARGDDIHADVDTRRAASALMCQRLSSGRRAGAQDRAGPVLPASRQGIRRGRTS
jgi:hypothetical protein